MLGAFALRSFNDDLLADSALRLEADYLWALSIRPFSLPDSGMTVVFRDLSNFSEPWSPKLTFLIVATLYFILEILKSRWEDATRCSSGAAWAGRIPVD